MLSKGYVQVYTGNGKGKTTAALGLALRCLCAGNRVFMGQFMKGQDYSELRAPEFLGGLTMKQFGDVNFVRGEASEDDVRRAKAGLAVVEEALASGKYDMVILDEANTAMHYGMVTVEEVLAAIGKRPERTEVVLTGRHAPQGIIDAADLVTEMVEVKHYYNKGVASRAGVEN
jgi:cob(I)alamin adenosyltransferase